MPLHGRAFRWGAETRIDLRRWTQRFDADTQRVPQGCRPSGFHACLVSAHAHVRDSLYRHPNAGEFCFWLRLCGRAVGSI